MNVKQFKRRFINGLVEPELFYIPVKKKEEKKINCDIYFIMSRSYDLSKKEWLPLSQRKWIEDITQINLSHSSVQCAYIIKDSLGNIIKLNKNSMVSSSYLYNIKCGKYYFKILKSNYAEVNNEWIEFTLGINDDNKTRYIELTPQNFLYKTETLLLQDAENNFFTDHINDCSTNKGKNSNIIGHAYGAKAIRFYDKNDQLIASMNTKNSGFHNPISIREESPDGVPYDKMSAFVLTPMQDIIKMSVSYELYCRSDNNYNNLLAASVSFTKYAPTRVGQGYLSENCLPTTLTWYHLTPMTINTDKYNNSYSNAQVVLLNNNSKNYYCYSPLEVERCYGYAGNNQIDYIESGQYKLDTMYSPDRYYDLNDTYIDYNLYRWLKNYDNYLKSYLERGTIDNIHFFDGLWIVKVITKETSKEDGRICTKIEYNVFYLKEKAISYAEKTIEGIESVPSDYYEYAAEYELIYSESELKFPFELELLDIFKYKDTLKTLDPQFYNNGEIIYLNGSSKITDENDKNYGIYLKYDGVHLFSYLQIADDYDQY